MTWLWKKNSPKELNFIGPNKWHIHSISRFLFQNFYQKFIVILDRCEKDEYIIVIQLAYLLQPSEEFLYLFQKLKEFLADAQAEGRSLALLYSTAVCQDSAVSIP